MSFRLNIFNMRSVITNPPTTFVVAQTTAMNPRTVLTVLYSAPAVTIEPTSEMPEIALVADINGVCSSGGTREITKKTRKGGGGKKKKAVVCVFWDIPF